MDKHRKYIIAGNWKMNKTAGESVELAESLAKELIDETLAESSRFNMRLC